MSAPAYRPFDQHYQLGEPPWSGPQVKAWEQAHGHDVRLKCYSEFGCMAIQYEADAMEEVVDTVRGMVADGHPCSNAGVAADEWFDRLCAVLARLDGGEDSS